MGGKYGSATEGVIKGVLGNNKVKKENKVKRLREHFESVLNGSEPDTLQGKSWR